MIFHETFPFDQYIIINRLLNRTEVAANVFLCLADLRVILLSNFASCTYSGTPLRRLPSTHGNLVVLTGLSC